MNIHPVVRKILALPPAKTERSDTEFTELDADGEALNPEEVEEERAEVEQRAKARSSSIEGVEMHRESKARRNARIAAQVLTIGAVGVLGAVGVKELVSDEDTTVIREVAEADEWPSAQSQATAGRWITAWLSAPENGSDAEAQANYVLDVDGSAPAPTSPVEFKNAPRVQQVLPGSVTPEKNGKRARVQVAVATKPKGSPLTWQTWDVPMAWDGTRAVVAGSPVLVSQPPAGEVDAMKPEQADADVTEASREPVEAYFRALAGTDASALAQITAPGWPAPQPVEGAQFVSLDEWSVPSAASDGETHEGTAVVTWQIGGAEVPTRYAVTLSKVESTWRVAATRAAY